MENRISRRIFLESTAVALGAAAVGTAGAADGQGSAGGPLGLGVTELSIAHPTRFRILQLTDLHFFSGGPLESSRNAKTVEIIRGVVKATKPDLVMATGDLWPENRDGMGETYMRQVIQEFEALDLPWAFVWGNHDQLADYAVGHEAFEKAKNSLYRGSASDGNYVIDVVNRHNEPVWQLICLNSHQDGLHIDPALPQKLAASNASSVPCFAFFHIPVKQYKEIWDNGAATGILAEQPCNEQEDGSALPILKSLGVRACFCGHDHVNDYSGVADGVELVYGRASGAGGYGVEILAKGGKLITTNCKSKRYRWATVLPDGERWVPKPGEHWDRSSERI
jgi:hypothetical protein